LAARTLPGRWNLSERLAGPQPEFRAQLFYDSLTDLQQALEAARSQQPRADLGSLVAAAPALELEEVLTPVPPGPPPNYVSRVVYEYAPGKLHELRALLDELMQRRSAAGGRSNLTVRVSGGAPALSMAGFYQDLGALEATRAQALADPAGAERLHAYRRAPGSPLRASRHLLDCSPVCVSPRTTAHPSALAAPRSRGYPVPNRNRQPAARY